jgi:hypothetical protein
MRPIWILIAGSVCLGLAGCSRSPVITVRNQSTQTVSNLVVSGTGFAERLGPLAAGAEHTFRIRPTGDSGVRVAFDAGAKHVDSSEQGYLEASGGYRLSATIETNLAVKIDVLR